MPLVIITPSSIGVSGSTAIPVSVAGSKIASGIPSGYTGPFAVETQTLTVNYVRVPTKMSIVSGTDSDVYSLSGNASRTMEVKETRLRAIVTATYSKKKDYNTYTTSAHQQLQKFGIIGDADPFGETYGNGLSSTRFLIGPAGTVITTQPYIRRVAWVDGTDTEVTRSIVGANFYVEQEVNGAGLKEPRSASVVFDDFNYGIDKDSAHTYLANGVGSYSITPEVIGTNLSYPIFGKYGRQKETDFRFTSWVDGIGHAVKNSLLWRPTWILNTDYTNTGGTVTLISSMFVGFSEYDTNMHSYD